VPGFGGPPKDGLPKPVREVPDAEASVLRNLPWEGVTSSWDGRAGTIPTPLMPRHHGVAAIDLGIA
jgi:hypothetical protein